MPSSPRRVKVTSPGRAYAAMAGATASMLCLGLLVPLVFGSPEVDQLTTRVPVDNSQIIGIAPADATVDATPDPTTVAPGATPFAGTTGTDPEPGTAVAGDGAVDPAAPAAAQAPAGPAAPAGETATPAGGAPQAGGSQSTPPAPPAGKPLTATDQGVTASGIKVGAILLDLSKVTALGLGLDNYDTDTQRRMFDTYFTRINDAGGINGRRITPVYATYDPLSTSGANSGPAICIRMAKDEKVFSVIGFTYTAGSCVAVQYKIPAVSHIGELQAVYQQSGNYMITSQPTQERLGRNWAAFLLDSGLSKGKKVGLLNVKDGGQSELVGNAVASTLSQLGQPVTYRAQLTSDEASASSQLPVEVQRMKAAGVEQVMLPVSFAYAISFMNQAEQQNYFPQYLTSDVFALASNGLIRTGPARSLANVIGVSTQSTVSPEGRTESAVEKDCREYYNRANPSSKQFAFGEEGPYNVICMDVEVLRRGTVPVGANLTRQAFVGAVQKLGPGSLPLSLGGSFAAGKTDFSDFQRPYRYFTACKCYKVAGPVAKARF